MCARFTLAAAEKELREAYDAKMASQWKPNYNIAITDETLVVTADEPDRFQPMHFGIVPWSSATGKMAGDWFNSRNDSLLSSKLWRPLLKNHKTCLVFTDGFYEWKRIPNGTAKPDKEPYRFTVKGRPVFAFAGLWSKWVNPVSKEPYYTFSIVTTESNEIVGEIHEKKRMPVILSKENEKIWLAKDFPFEQLVDICQPYPDDLMDRYRVSPRINSVNKKDAPVNDPDLILPENSL